MGRTAKPWYRKGAKAWYVELDGRQIPLARGAKDATKAEARREFHRLMASRKEAVAVGPTLGALADLFADYLVRETAPLTVEWYKRHLGSFVRHVGKHFPAADVRPLHVTAWLEPTTLGPTTRHGAMAAVRRLFRWGKRQGHLAADPMTDLEKPTPKPRETDLTAEQAQAIRAAYRSDDPFVAFMDVLHETGMRPSEAMGLEASEIDFDGREIRRQGKGRARVIRLTDAALELLRRLAAQHPEGPVLRNSRGTPWTRNSTACRFARLRARIGVGREATAESFRHSFVTDGLERGVSVSAMAELVGHKSTKMIDKHYSKLRERTSHLHEAVAKVRPPRVTPTNPVEASRPDDHLEPVADESLEHAEPEIPPPARRPALPRKTRGTH
jgi:integrase